MMKSGGRPSSGRTVAKEMVLINELWIAARVTESSVLLSGEYWGDGIKWVR